MDQLRLIGPSIDLPVVTDPQQAAVGWSRWNDRVAELKNPETEEFCHELADDPIGRGLLEGVFTHSSFLTNCIVSELDFLRSLLIRGPESEFSSHIKQISNQLAYEEDQQKLMTGLRQARRKVALLAALCDITGYWPLSRVTECLSTFADAALSAAVSHLFLRAVQREELRLPDPDMPEEGCGVVVLAMGKYGARELNYSSDIDLIILFDPLKVDYTGKRNLQADLVRMVRDLVTIIEQRTADGYVARTDLRLRPEPSSNPTAIAVPAALSYYQRRGQDWERAAMIKARPVSGDLQVGRHFLKEIETFVWRDRLDFWAMRAIQAIKRQIDAHRGGTTPAVAGHNIKLGRGGIREIEFLAQALQLIHGGRDTYLRCSGTVDALTTLAEAGLVAEQTTADLIRAYEFLRQLEHRLQMVNDEQTQTLPKDESQLEKLANFMQYRDLEMFEQHILQHLRQVEDHYGDVFGRTTAHPESKQASSAGNRGEPMDDQILKSMGFAELGNVREVVRTWHESSMTAIESKQSRELLRELLPRILEAASRAADPDAALRSFDAFLKSLEEDARLFLSILCANHSLLNLTVDIVSTAPALTKRLVHDTRCLDGFTREIDIHAAPNAKVLAAECSAQLQNGADDDTAAETAYRWYNKHVFEVGTNTLRYTIDWHEAGQQLADIADGLVHSVHEFVLRELSTRFRLEKPGLVVLALGKYGTGELMFSSPIDLLIAVDDEGGDSNAERELAQRFCSLLRDVMASEQIRFANATLSNLDNEFEVVSLGEFDRYLAEVDDNSLYLNLIGSRVVIGHVDRVVQLENHVNSALARSHDPAPLHSYLQRFGGAMLNDHAADSPLGIADTDRRLDLIIRYLRLTRMQHSPQIVFGPHHRAITMLMEMEGAIAPFADRLSKIYNLISSLFCVFNTAMGSDGIPRPMPTTLQALLTRATGVSSPDALQQKVSEARQAVDALFNEIVSGLV